MRRMYKIKIHADGRKIGQDGRGAFWVTLNVAKGGKIECDECLKPLEGLIWFQAETGKGLCPGCVRTADEEFVAFAVIRPPGEPPTICQSLRQSYRECVRWQDNARAWGESLELMGICHADRAKERMAKLVRDEFGQ